MALNKFDVTGSLAREFNKGQDCCKNGHSQNLDLNVSAM